MPEITIEKLSQLLGSAKANRKETLEKLMEFQNETRELVANYDGAIKVLQLLLDDLQAQDINTMSLEDFKKMMPQGVEVEGIHVKDAA